jgi:hypothetical protein
MMKAITYKGIYSPIVKNNGCEVTIRCKNPGTISTFDQVIPYSEFSARQQKMLARNKTCVEMKKVKSYMNPDGPEIEIPVDSPASCDPSTETYWSM